MVLSGLENSLKDSVEWSLKHSLISNAIFLAERLCAEPSSSAEEDEMKLHLLAQCYLAENSPQKIILLLKTSTSEENKYMYAHACYQAGQFEEAERTLIRSVHIPMGSAGYFLLAQICEKQGRIQDAIAYYKQALQLNPILWTAFEKLCRFGHFIDPTVAFAGDSMPKENPEATQYLHQETYSNIQFQPLSSSYIENWSPQPEFNSPSPNKPKTAKDLGELLTDIGKGYQSLAKYETDEALENFKILPSSQLKSGWVQCQIAKAYFEKYDFPRAIDHFQRGFAEEPQRIEDSDIYSSALWYEKRASDLCYLLHNSLKKAYYAPQTWIIAGNFYSLQKERDTAIKCFNRAIQLNPFHSYSYSLCGHEHMGNSDFEKAKYHYEAAKNMDPRQYTALWGLGSLYYKQEKYSQSLQCYKAARTINPRSSILLTYLGVNFKALGQYQEAIECYNQALRLDSKNPLPRFQLAILLSTMNRDQEALTHLENLRQESPKEAHLYIQMGKIHAKLGHPERALKYYNDAQELNPKNTTEIKNLIEQLHGIPNFGMGS